MKNIFEASTTTETIQRIEKLNSESKPLWGTMAVGQMLAHCNVSYELVFEDKHPKPNAVVKLLLKILVKNAVVSEKPYKHSIRTGPVFIIKETKDFAAEKKRLIDYFNKTQQLGEAYFDGKESNSFGKLTKGEWNNMFYKHVDHHLSQFGV